MKRKINVVTTDRADYPDLDSENLSMVKSLNNNGINSSLTSWHAIYEQLIADNFCNEILLIRTVWDYPEYLDKFRHFISLLKKNNIITVNPPEIIEWNISKKYLFDLQDAGIPIVPCVFYPAGSVVYGNTVKSVVKPVIGLGAVGAQILNEGMSVSVNTDSIVNPFRNSIHNGELSVVMISGKPVLFIRKTPALTDWRVQPQYGGIYQLVEKAPDGAISICNELFKYIQNKFQSEYLLFMRVDLIQNDFNKEWEILEFEAIDPSLYGSVSSLAVDALSRSLSNIF